MTLRIMDPDAPAPDPDSFTTAPLPPKPKRRPSVKRGVWTLVARGCRGKGVRVMFKAETVAKAMKRGYAICKSDRLEFVAVFPGRMAALRYA